MNKNKLIIIILAVFCFVLCIRCDNDRRRIAQLENQLYELTKDLPDVEAPKQEKKSTSSSSLSSSSSRSDEGFVGKYRVVDAYNTTWILTLNDDETVTVSEEGSTEVKYGSWDLFPYQIPQLSFSYDDYPYLIFPSGRENINWGLISEDYLYPGSTDYKAKNPNKRLPVEKIK